MTVLQDPYAELGVARGASEADIRRAYRRLVKDLHPDARPGDRAAEERFKRVTSAFSLLSDAGKRRRFDRGEIDAEGNDTVGARPDPAPGAGGGPDLSDILDGVFGDGATGGPFRQRRNDVRYRLEVAFEEAALGGRKRVVMDDGRTLDLVVPEGVKTGQVLRLRGQGRPANGAAAGDALVEIEVADHPYFERVGDDVRIDLPVTLQEAVLGAKIKAPTLSGPVTLTIPRGSNTGAVLRLRGKGVKGAHGRGDQLVSLVVMLPERMDAKLASFLSDWTPDAGYDPRKKMEL